jgi:hypothetical protein
MERLSLSTTVPKLQPHKGVIMCGFSACDLWTGLLTGVISGFVFWLLLRLFDVYQNRVFVTIELIPVKPYYCLKISNKGLCNVKLKGLVVEPDGFNGDKLSGTRYFDDRIIKSDSNRGLEFLGRFL